MLLGMVKGSEYITKSPEGDYLGGTKPLQKHFIKQWATWKMLLNLSQII